jgi:hypothetical protein
VKEIDLKKIDDHITTMVSPDLARDIGYDVDVDDEPECVCVCICGWAAGGSRRRVKLRRWAHLVWSRIL